MIKTVIVRNQKELDDCLKVRFEVFTKEQGIPQSIDIDEYDVIDFSKCCHAAVYDDDKPVAAGRLKYIGQSTVQFNRVAVLKSYRGRKIGSMLIHALEKYALDMGYTDVYLESQSSAKDFYMKLGYEDMGEDEFIEAGIPHVKLKKSLIT